MSSVAWLTIFVLMYWAYCIFWGIKGAQKAKSASDYFIAGRSISIWVFVLAATATSFSGWTFMGHPALVWRDGIPYGYASFYAITIPFTGVIFLKRQWLLGKKYGFVTPGEMYSTYYGTDALRYLTVLVAMVFSVPYLGLQLRASGFLFNVLTHGMMSLTTGMWLLAIIVVIYVGLGGLRSVAYVDTVQCILLAVGIISIGIIALNQVGGWNNLQKGIVELSQNKYAHAVTAKGEKLKVFDSGGSEVKNPEYLNVIKGFLDEKGKNLVRVSDDNGNRIEFWNLTKKEGTGVEIQGDGTLATPMKIAIQSRIKKTPDGYAHYIAIPGVIQFEVPGTKAQGGVWTGIMILTYMFALMGIQSAPAFSMWAFANKNPAPFAPQQVWASSFGIGIILLTATWIQGFAGHILINQDILSPIPGGKQAALIPEIIDLMSNTAPFLVGLLAVCALAAMQSTGAAYMSTASGMITRDLYKHVFAKDLGHSGQKFVGRIAVLIVVGLALMIATFATDALVMLGGLAVSYGFQMWPALMGVCFFPWLTRQGIVVGLIAGLIAVTVTYIGDFGVKYAFTIHSAGWGIFFNLGLAIIVSAVTQPDKQESDRRAGYHSFLKEFASIPENKRHLIPVAWGLVIGWFLLAIGPLTPIIGNSIFGDPNDATTWIFNMPSIWAWALLMWAIGVFMMWFLAYHLEFSTNIKGTFESIDDYADHAAGVKAPVRMDLDSP